MKKCKICGLESNRLRRGMCPKHYKQWLRHGHCINNNSRSKYDPNEIVICDDYAEIILYDKYGSEKDRALIDIDDIDKVKNIKWHLTHYGYVSNNENKQQLHRFIMNCPEDMVVDHINHNILDNRKSNLRICTKQQNNMNVKKGKNNTSGIVGVCWDKCINKWLAQITYNYKNIYLGHFNTKEEAIEARKQAEIDLFGDYRNKEDEE